MTLFTLQPTRSDSGTLSFAAKGADLFNSFLGLPIFAEGGEFGTASWILSWPAH